MFENVLLLLDLNDTGATPIRSFLFVWVWNRGRWGSRQCNAMHIKAKQFKAMQSTAKPCKAAHSNYPVIVCFVVIKQNKVELAHVILSSYGL